MGTLLSRADYRKQFPAINQGLFIFGNSKRLPKDVTIVNLGQSLSSHLLKVSPESRTTATEAYLRQLAEPYSVLVLTNIEVLFTPSLQQDPIRSLLMLCRNRKVCIFWPGKIDGTILTYAYPSSPEYYTTDYSDCIDTYVIAD